VTASDLRPGDVLHLETGDVTVIRLEDAHHGIEMLVRAAPRKGHDASESDRLIWLWPNQDVRATQGKPSSDKAACPGAAISRRVAARASHARRRALEGKT